MLRSIVICLCFSLSLSLSGSPILAQSEPVGGPPNYPGFPQTDDISGRVDFSSPTVVDINNDGKLDILLGDNAGCIRAWHANSPSSGSTVSGFPWETNINNNCSGDDRVEGALAVADIDGNDGGLPEVVGGSRGISANDGPYTPGKVFVWQNNGALLAGWPKSMAWGGPNDDTPEVQSVALGNLSGDSRLEIVAGTTNHACPGCSKNLYAWDLAGNLLSGNFPLGSAGTADAGIFGAVATANITGDSYAEIITGRDHRYMYAYLASGGNVGGWPRETYVSGSSGSYIEFTNNGAAIGDLDFNGVQEIVIAGRVRSSGHQETNVALLVFEPDGSRRSGWSSAKLGVGPALYGSFPPSMYPALGDLDADGKLEIVVAMGDGHTRAYRENGTLMWDYNFANGQVLFGSEPVIGDITGDGYPEVIFGTYSPNNGNGSANNAVRMIGLDRNGNPLTGLGFPLTLPNESQFYGVRAGPTLADLDKNGDLELIAGSWGGVLYVWNLQNAPLSSCRALPWPTSRHDNWRSAFYNGPSLLTGSSAPTTPALPALSAPEGGPYTVYFPFITRC
jgi:hypothetical protein